MNKKELAEYERVATLAAFMRTNPVNRDVPKPVWGKGEKYITGWQFNAYSMRTWLSWSESNAHGDGEYPDGVLYRSASQNGIALFSTESLALRAMRHEVEMECARKLRDIDKKIEAAGAKEHAE